MTTTAIRPSGGQPSQLIAAEIRAELGRQQVSQRQLALMTGVSYAWVQRRISACDVELTLEDVQLISDALKVPPVKFLRVWLPPLDSNQQPAGLTARLRALPTAA